MSDPQFCSGFGQFHTNEPDPGAPGKTLKPYTTIVFEQIRLMVDSPPTVDKAQGQWLIPSTLLSRTFKEQESDGCYWLLWADCDKNPPAIDDLAAIINSITGGSDCECYNSRSATPKNQKARALIPLGKPLCYADWQLAQVILNDKLESLNVVPDRSNERAAQLCYLPNRGVHYGSVSKRDGANFDPLTAWAAEIANKKAERKADEEAIAKARSEAQAKKAKLKETDSPDCIGAFNLAFTPQDIMLQCGYEQRGENFRHPHSESGSFSARVQADSSGVWRVNSLSTSDPLYSNGKGAHDAFSAFCALFHGGDKGAAIKDAGDNWLTIDGVSYNKAKQREWAQNANNSGSDGAPHSDGDDWPHPKPLPADLPPVKPFDFGLLPETLQPWARDICERVQCAPDYVGVAVMAGLGSIIGRKVGIRPQAKTDWTVTTNQWGLVIGRPGVLKSPAMEVALSPLKRLAAEAVNAHDGEMAEYKARSILFKLQQESAATEVKNKLKKGGASESELLGSLKLDEPEIPALRRYIANDTTAAALGEMHRQNPNGLLVFRDELVSLLKSLDREDNAEARGFYLTSWNGDSPYTFDRIARGFNLHIPAVCLSLLGSTQPGRIADYIRQAVRGGSGDDGLIQRFGLLVWPDNDGAWQDVDRWPDSVAKQQANRIFTLLDQLKAETIGAQQDTGYNNEPDGLPYLRFDADAMGLFLEWRTDLESKLRSGELHPAMESHLAKYRKLVPGLALILHLANEGQGSVTEQATLQALAWAEYLESHAQRAYVSITTAELAAAKAIIRRIRKGDLPKCFSSRDVWRPCWANLSDREQVADALQLLVELDWLSVRIVETAGRKATVYEANPKGFNL